MKKRSLVLTNIIGFIAGTFIFGIAGVYAVTYFSSTNTTYDNSSSGMSSTNVQTAIDELYNVCKPSAGEQIIEDNNLQKDPYECRYFFTGANPNNYITFNNETTTWRIISIGCDNTIKIMRYASTFERAWDTASPYGNNNWNRPATLNTYLNGDYYNSLTSIAKSQIITASYYAGAVTENNNALADQIVDEKATVSNVKVALLTLSEYLRSNSNANCKTFYANNRNYNTCQKTNWMANMGPWWTLSPDSSEYDTVFYVSNHAEIGGALARHAYNDIMPVVTLSSKVQITGGTGSKSNPYTLG